MVKPTRVSVVIPTFERPNDLKQALSALTDKTNSQPWQIIVSDDSHDDRSRKLVEDQFPSVLWVQGKKNGPAGNRNAGSARASGEWIIFIDDDCIPEPKFVEFYKQAIKYNPEIWVFEGRIFPDRVRKTWAEGCPENSSGGMLWTSNLCIKRSLFEELGGFDERFTIAYEDVEFAHRLKQSKFRSVFVPEAAVCHPWRTLREGGKNWKKKGYQIESLLLFLDKHEDARNEFGKPTLYLRNFFRIITSNLVYCLFSLRGKGIDLIVSQAMVSLKTFYILAFCRK